MFHYNSVIMMQETRTELPEPKIIHTVIAGGRKIEILEYVRGESPDLGQTKAIAAKMGKDMLTIDDCNEILGNKTLRNAIEKKLGHPQWGFVLNSDPGKESESVSPIFGYFLFTVGYTEDWPADQHASLVLLKDKTKLEDVPIDKLAEKAKGELDSLAVRLDNAPNLGELLRRLSEGPVQP